MFFWRKRIKHYGRYASLLKGKRALEIGGPSGIFNKRGLVPLYSVLASVDGCNFNSKTVWEGVIQEGPGKYLYDKRRPAGHQYIREAVALAGIEPQTYDVILSSHCIEHVANPLKAVSEWIRVLKDDGLFVLVVPHRDGTFDHKRPVTQLVHLIEDRNRNVAEDDLTHLPEILQCHDLAMDPPSGDIESFRQRSLKNIENRCLHQHVFDTHLAVEVVDHIGLRILDVQTALPYHIIILAQKLVVGPPADNASFLSASADYHQVSVFLSDRAPRENVRVHR
jgi:SAM-dependent methyltransferase